MKNRKTPQLRIGHGRSSFALRPLSLAVCLAVCGPALGLPQGGKVVAGEATIQKPTPTTQVITQSTDKAIIDWRSFSIAAGEKVRFDQPSSTSITLNRVTGYDPSYLLGEMSANGRIFLLNPYGVVFGAGARIDVGGMVASSLSLANNDFLAGRYTLTSVDSKAPALRGEVRNEGSITANGGTVALVAPVVSNTGTITANGGRVGMAAANQVSVDVEGDGLIFFQASATEASNRLQQLGRIQADGGSVELRAAARGAFADTVLNMSGVVQAKTLGTRGGRIVIDGGEAGITRVGGTLDASGSAPGSHGGEVTAQGQLVLFDSNARLDASGDAGGGMLRVGGDFHGANPDVRNASQTVVATGAELRADALTRGDGGRIVIWSNDSTRYFGQASATGGAAGGNGGSAEVSGKRHLEYAGTVDLRAPSGAIGTLLLDPTDITISTGVQPVTMTVTGAVDKTFSDTTSTTSTSILNQTTLQNQLGTANVTVDATPTNSVNDSGTGSILVSSTIDWASGFSLTLKAASTITVNNAITNTGNGGLNLFADGAVTVGAPISLAGGSFRVAGTAGIGSSAASYGGTGTITTSGVLSGVAGGNVDIATTAGIDVAAIAANGGGGFTPANAGNVTLTTVDGAIRTASIHADGGVGTLNLTPTVGGNGGTVVVTAAGATSHTLDTGTISALGGRGPDTDPAQVVGGSGGNGGPVSIGNTSGGNSTVAAISASGGRGGDVAGPTGLGGAGGGGGAITIDSSGGTLTLANVTTLGGGGGTGTTSNGSAGAGSTIAVTFGQASTGTLDLTSSVFSAASSSATGGASPADTIVLAGGAGSITLADALLTRTGSVDTSLSSIEVAQITAGAGTTSVSGWTAGRTATIQLTAGAGTITGNGAPTTLVGLLAGSNFTINNGDAGSVGGTAFTGVGTLLGLAGADTFNFTSTGSLSGGLDGGSGAANTLNGGAAGSTFTLTGANAGTIDTTPFANIASITGGAGPDAFVVQNAGTLSGALNGGGGSNSLDLSNKIGAVAFGLLGATSGTATDIGGNYSNVATLVGNGALTTLTGTNTASTYTITANNTGNVNGTTSFSGVANLAGGIGNDTFVIGPGFNLASIDGGAGANSLTVTADTTESLTLAPLLLTRDVGSNVILAGIGSATLIGGSGINTIAAGSFTGPLTLQLSGGADILTGNGTNTTLRAQAGGSTIDVTGAGSGNADAGTFSGVTSLLGGSGADAFAISTGSLLGGVDGGTGTNTLSLAGKSGALSIAITGTGAGTATGLGSGFANIASVTGNGATTTLSGAVAGSAFIVSGSGSGTVDATTGFNGVGNLLGSAGTDSFLVQAGGVITGSINGAGGSNTLTIAKGTVAINLTGAGTGDATGVGSFSNIGTLAGNNTDTTLTGPAAGATFTVATPNAGNVDGTTSFSGVTSLVGGTGADTFVLNNLGTLTGSIDGGVGAGNTLDLGNKVGAAAFGLSSANSGSATGVGTGYTHVSTLKGNGSGTTLTGTIAGSTYTVDAVNGGNVDSATFFSGVGNLAGGTGVDFFLLQGIGALGGSISGGSGATNHLDLSGKTGAVTITLSSASAGTATGIGTGYSGITDLVGNGNSTTLVGTGGATTFNVLTPNAGNVNAATTFGQVGNLTGGSGNDGFVLQNTGTLGGNVDGGGGSNTLNLANKLGAVAIGLTGATAGTATGLGGSFANINILNGTNAATTLTGLAGGSAFSVSGSDTGTVGGITFNNIGTLRGQGGADTFTIVPASSLSGGIDGGGGANSLFVTANTSENLTLQPLLLMRSVGGDITIANIGAATLTGGTGINVINAATFGGTVALQVTGGADTLVGNGANTTLVADAGGTAFNVTGSNSGMAGTSSFSQVANLMGGAGVDTFTIGGSTVLLGGNIIGSGNDTLNLATRIGPITISQTGLVTNTGVGGTTSGINAVVGNGSPTTFLGDNVDQTYNITGSNAFSVGGQTLTGVGSIVAGSGNDVFLVQNLGTLSGSIDGGLGSNTLNLGVKSGAVAIGLTSPTSGTATGIGGGYANVATLVGNNSNSTLTGTGAGSTYTVAGTNTGNIDGTTSFSGITNLAGGSGADTFTLGAGFGLSGIDGGGGLNTLNATTMASENLSLSNTTLTRSLSGSTTLASIGKATLAGGGGDNVISASTFTGTLTLLSSTGNDSLTGNGANTTLVGFAAGNAFNVTGANAGSNGSTSFAQVANLLGGAGADTFTFGSAGSLSGSIDGAGGANVLNLAARASADFALSSSSAGTASAIGGSYANVATLVGNNTSSTLAGTATGSTFAVGSANAGTVNDGVGTTTFSGMASLAGGAGADVFRIANAGSLTGNVAGGGGSNSLDLSTRGSADFTLTGPAAGTAGGIGGNFGGIGTLVGNNGSSTLTGSNAGSAFVLTGSNAGTVNGSLAFSGIGSLAGGTGNDSFAIGNFSLSGTVNGGAGVNSLDLSARGGAVAFTLASAISGNATGITGGYSNVSTLAGNGAATTLTGTSAGSTYTLTGSNAGNIGAGATVFSGIANLVGGIGSDVFAVNNGGSIASIDGGSGAANTLSLATRSSADFALSGAATGSASGVGTYTGITSLVGNGTSSTLSGTNAGSTYQVVTSNAGLVDGATSFSGIANLAAGSGTDAFTVAAGAAIGSLNGGAGSNSLAVTTGAAENLTLADALLTRSVSGSTTLANIGSATLTGGSGNNIINAGGWTGARTLTLRATTGTDQLTGNGLNTTLIGADADSVFSLTGANAGTLQVGANTTSFSGVGNLTGGSLNDLFVIQNAGTLSGNLDGGGGSNTLDLSNKSGATLVFSSSGSSATGSGIAGSLFRIGNLIGNSSGTTLQGDESGQSFVISGNNQITVGGQTFQGVANLQAGAGADNIDGSPAFKLTGNIDDAGGLTTLTGTIQTDGHQTYLGPVIAPTASLAALGGLTALNPGNDFGSVSLTGGFINLRDANAIDLLSVALGSGQALTLTAGGTITLHGNVSSSADQTYNGNLLLAASAALGAGSGSIAVNGSIEGGANDLALSSSNAAANAITLAGSVTGVAAFSASGNTRLSGSVTSTGTQTYGGTLTLTQASTLDAGASRIVLQGVVDAGGNDLLLKSTNGAADAIRVGGNVGNVNAFTAQGASTLAANVVSTGTQTYAGPVALAADAGLDAGAAKIAIQGAVAGGGHNLSLASSNAATDAIGLGGAVSGIGTFAANGNAKLAGNVTSSGAQTYFGSVLLAGNATLDAGASRLDLRSTVDAAGHDLGLASTNAAADAIKAAAAITGAGQLTVSGRSTLATGVTTTRGQLYTGAVTIGSSSTFSGTSLGFNGGIVANAFDLGLRADSLSIGGPVVGSGNATLSTLSAGASLGIAGGAGTLQVDQATLDRFAGFTGLTLGRSDGGGDLAFGNLVLPTQLNVLSGSGNATFGGTVASAAGQARSLSVATAGTTTFVGTVGGAIGGAAALGTLSVAGAAVLDASVTSNGAQTYGGNVTLGGDATLSASALDLRGSLAIGNHALTLLGDAIGLAGAASGSGTVRLASHDAAGSIGIAGGAGTLQLLQTLVDRFAGVSLLTIGRSDGSGTITANGLTLPTDLAIAGGSGNVSFTATVDSAGASARDLTVGTTGTTSFAGIVGGTRGLDALTVGGTSRIGANVSAVAQTYTGAVTLTGDSTLSAGSVLFGSTVDGARALIVNATTTRFGGAVGSTTALTSLRTDAAGTTELGGNVTTSGVQSYGDRLQLNADATLSASSLTLDGAVDGAHALGLSANGGVALNAPIGATTDLTQLTVNGPLQLKAGTVRTTGAQTYNGAVTLGAAESLRASSVSFTGSVDGPFRLAVQSPGVVSFGGGVGLGTALDSLAVSGGGSVRLLGTGITTTNDQNYAGALQLDGSKTLRGSALTLGGAVSGAADLTLQTNALTGATALAGSGVLTIVPIDLASSIGVAGGSGSLQVTQATLGGISGFTSTVIGAANGSGSINVGAATLRTATTLQTDSGDINVATSIDGPVAVTLNSGGTTRISGSIGATTPLLSLTTDNNPNRADLSGATGEHTSFEGGGGRVVTTGAQTYNDPVTATGNLSLSGGVITATQAANRFDGVVSASATSLALNASTDLRLGAVTLANGGTITSDGVLHLTGSLRLDGGTLVLLTNAPPQPGDLTDPDYKAKAPVFGATQLKEQSATIVQDAGATLSSAAGSLLVLRSPKNGSILLDRAGNTLLGSISASSGSLNDNDSSRFTSAGATLPISVIRIVSSEIHVAGKNTDAGGNATPTGLEADTIRLTADQLSTGADGLIRARLIYNNLQGSPSSLPSLILELSAKQLAQGGGFGTAASPIQIRAGGVEGGFITALPKGASGDNAVVFLAGDAAARPFYDGTGQINAVRIFFNGQATRTPQEAGALAAVIALIEDARHTRFEEAVRTENVSSRLRSGVIAEVGAGRPATVGREGIRPPETCDAKPGTLSCP